MHEEAVRLHRPYQVQISKAPIDSNITGPSLDDPGVGRGA